MIPSPNANSITFYISTIAIVGLMMFSGCTNRSPVNFSPNTLFGQASQTATAGDLQVRESYSTSTEWFESYENAHRESLRTGKPILAAFTGSDWCGPCIGLKKNVFDSAEFQTWAPQNVVLLELDFPKKVQQDPKVKSQNERLARKHNIAGYPTVLFLDSDGEVMGKLGHSKDAKQWIASADKKLR
jgi:protein disulfide-isomerase